VVVVVVGEADLSTDTQFLKRIPEPINGKLPVDIANWITRKRFGFESIDLENWDLVTAEGDVVVAGGNSAGSGYVKISKGLGSATKKRMGQRQN
jgi:hypothetical protein